MADSPKSTLQLGLLMCNINTLTGTTSNWSFTYGVTLDQYMLNKAHLMTSTVTTQRCLPSSPDHGGVLREPRIAPPRPVPSLCAVGGSAGSAPAVSPVYERLLQYSAGPYAQKKNYQAHFTLRRPVRQLLGGPGVNYSPTLHLEMGILW